jgi:hypothetical protein
MEPDKIIAAWLIKTHVDPRAVFTFVAKGTEVTNGVPFDVPESVYVRDHKRSASEIIAEENGIHDSKALFLAAFARKTEFGMWQATFSDQERQLLDQLQKFKESPSTGESLEAAMRLLDQFQPSQ